MKTLFSINITDEMVYEEVCDQFLDELEDRLGHEIDDKEYVRLCTSIVDEMGSKPIGISHRDGIDTRFGEWFADVLPETLDLVTSHLRDAMDCFIEQKIDEMYGREGE